MSVARFSCLVLDGHLGLKRISLICQVSALREGLCVFDPGRAEARPYPTDEVGKVRLP